MTTLILIAAWVSVACLSDVINTSNAYAVQSVPYQMNFQGRLNNASGAPMATGTYNMVFRIYSAATGGSALWTETRAVSAGQGVSITSGGLFSVQLGSVTSLPSNIFNTSSPLYLEVELPSPATATTTSPSWTEGPMGPRNPIVSSPFAVNSDLLDGLDSSAFAAASGSANYIQNQGASPQAANFNISGTGTAASLQAASLDTASAGALTLGGMNATSLILAQNTTLNAGRSLTLTGGITSTRPASPTEGMVYYDTSTRQLLTYSNGKWQATSSNTTIVVAANNSTQAEKDGARFVGNGTADDVAINAALAALPSTGGTVVLDEGTYNISAVISLNTANTTIMGQGTSTVLKRAYNTTTANLGMVSIGTGNISIRNLYIDGNKATYTNTMDDGIGSASCQSQGGSVIDNVTIANSAGSGINPNSACNGSWYYKVTNNNIYSNTGDGIVNIANSTISENQVTSNGGNGYSRGYRNIISNNTFSSNGSNGVNTGTADVITSNTVDNNTGNGIMSSNFDSTPLTISNNAVSGGIDGIHVGPGANYVSVTGNIIDSPSNNGITIDGGTISTNITITSNTITAAGANGIGSSNSTNDDLITNNKIYNSGGTGSSSGIAIRGDNNTIASNYITDTAGTGYAIAISYGTNNTLSGNTYSGTGASSIYDGGTSTIYSNQLRSSTGDFLTKPGSDSVIAFQIQNASGSSALTVDTTNSLTRVSGSAVLQSTVASSSPTPTIIGSGATSSANATSRSVSTNSSTQTGDLVILVGYMEPANEGSGSATYGTISPPAGVTLASGFPINTDDGFITSADTHRLYVWYYYATANGTQSLNFTDTQNVYWGITATTIRGGPASGNPFADIPNTNTVSTSAAGNTSTPNVSLSLSGSNNLVLWAFGDWNGGLPGTPTGYTGVISSTNNAGQPAVASKVYASSGSTGVVSASVSGNDRGMTAALLSIRGPSTSTQPLAVKSTSGAQIFSISGTGSVLSQNSLDSTIAFQIQNAAGTVALNVDTTTNTITLGSGSNTVTFTGTNGLIASGSARHTKTILLTPEYAGAVLDAASDASCSSANSGTMTSGLDNTNRMNYYNWTSTSASAQCYDVVVQVPIPADFNGWASAPDIRLSKDSTGTASYAINVTDSTGTTDTNYNYSAPGTLSTSWANMATSVLGNNAGTNGTTSYVPGGYFTIKIRVSSTSSANVKLGNIKLTYSSTF